MIFDKMLTNPLLHRGIINSSPVRKPVWILLLTILIYSCAPAPKFTTDEGSRSSTPVQSDGSVSPVPDNFQNPSGALKTYKGTASYYADKFHGNKTANGEIYDMYGLTAAHPTFPFGTKLRVVNLDNGKSVKVIVNDRMPERPDRIIDLSLGAAKKLGMIEAGLAEVRLEILKWGK